MFTGLIEKKGLIKEIRPRGNGLSIIISTSPWDDPVILGESIAVDGICLTVSGVLSDFEFYADVLKETVARTSLAFKKPGAQVNLERALKASHRIGGHFVSGHVDGVGRIGRISLTGSDHIVRTVCDSALLQEMVVKGSVALEGLSLTVTGLGPDWFEVNIIPHTWEITSVSELVEGDAVNIETDILAKYIRKYMNGSGAGDSIIKKMEKAGFPVTHN